MGACWCTEAEGPCMNLAPRDSPDQMCDECEHGNHDAHESPEDEE